MKVFITGASGFVGTHVLEILKKQKYEIYALSRNVRFDEEVQWIQGDINDFDFIEKLLNNVQPKILIHLAWYVNAKDCINSIENINFLKSSQNLFEQFLKNKGKRILCTGSCFEYDLNYGLLSELITPTINSNLYANCKNILHLYLEALSKAYEFEYTWARLFYMYGPNEPMPRLVPSIINSLLNNEVARCSEGKQLRDYMYVKDVAKILNELIIREINGIINVSTGSPLTIREIGRTIEKIFNLDEQINYGAFIPRPGEPHLIMGTSITDKLEGIKLTSLEEGLDETIQWWRDYKFTKRRSIIK